MIGLPEILILLVFLLVVGGIVVAGTVIWIYVLRPKKDPRGAPGRKT